MHATFGASFNNPPPPKKQDVSSEHQQHNILHFEFPNASCWVNFLWLLIKPGLDQVEKNTGISSLLEQ